MKLSDDAFRARLADVLDRSGLSRRALSGAMGRDPGYIAALLDPTRPSRARPTPADLLAASDATGIALVDLLERLWAIPLERLADELGANVGSADVAKLTAVERAEVQDVVAFLVTRRVGRGGRRGAR